MRLSMMGAPLHLENFHRKKASPAESILTDGVIVKEGPGPVHMDDIRGRTKPSIPELVARQSAAIP